MSAHKQIVAFNLQKPQFLVLSGDGINCEHETAAAIEKAGGSGVIMHINTLMQNPKDLLSFDALVIPGGFSFGDALGSGQILSLKLRYKLGDYLLKFVSAQKPILGICNGFQTLLKLGLLPFCDMNKSENILKKYTQQRVVALSTNAPNRFNKNGGFINQWVELQVENSHCIWTSNMSGSIYLPIRHGEGRVKFFAGKEDALHQCLTEKSQIPLRYTQDINGSYGNIAAICDSSGTILGLMPHPEAFIYHECAPYISFRNNKTKSNQGDGFAFFNNAVRYLQA